MWGCTLLNRLAVVEAHRKGPSEERPAAKEDLDGLVEEVFVWARAKINFGNISSKLPARRALDIDALKSMQLILSGIDFPQQVTLGQNVISPSALSTELQRRIDELQTEFENLTEIQIDTKLSFLIAGNARQLVFAAAVCSKRIPELVTLVRDKIRLLQPIQVRVLWSWVQEELSPATSTPVIDHSGLLPPGRTHFADISRAYTKRSELRLQREIARFLIERGIYAIGTKFGRYETDFVIGAHADYYVIEVKKYGWGKAITDRGSF